MKVTFVIMGLLLSFNVLANPAAEICRVKVSICHVREVAPVSLDVSSYNGITQGTFAYQATAVFALTSREAESSS